MHGRNKDGCKGVLTCGGTANQNQLGFNQFGFNQLGFRQAGFSLVELIVIVLIMAIVSGAVIMNVTYYRKASVDSCAGRLAAILEKARLETMSVESKVELEVWYDTGTKAYYACIKKGGSRGDAEELGNDALTIIARTDPSGPSDKDIKSYAVTIEFDKSTGAFKSTPLYDEFEIIGSKTKKVIMVRDTGRSFVEE